MFKVSVISDQIDYLVFRHSCTIHQILVINNPITGWKLLGSPWHCFAGTLIRECFEAAGPGQSPGNCTVSASCERRGTWADLKYLDRDVAIGQNLAQEFEEGAQLES